MARRINFECTSYSGIGALPAYAVARDGETPAEAVARAIARKNGMSTPGPQFAHMRDGGAVYCYRADFYADFGRSGWALFAIGGG